MAQLIWRGDLVDRLGEEAAARGLYEAGESLLEYANRSVPLDEGVLEASGVVAASATWEWDEYGVPHVTVHEQVRRDRGQIATAVAYNTPYAIVQHEELTYRHAPGRRAKWLELSLNERRAALQAHVARRIRAGIGG